MQETLQEAVQFFKAEKAYDKLFRLFRQKFESLGRIGGTVSVKSFSNRELEEIGKFFGLHGEQLQKKGLISLQLFEEQLQHTKFDMVTLKQLLDTYFGEKILSKKELRLANEAKLQAMLMELKIEFTSIVFWLDFLLERRAEGRWIIRLVESKEKEFNKYVRILANAYSSLPKKAERLPMFSQRITGNPHAFDLQTDLGRMFIHLLAVHRFKNLGEMTESIFPVNTEEINELLEAFLIYRDDLLNFVTCANLIAEVAEGIQPVWEAAARKNTVQIVPLRELVAITKVEPVVGNKVWVVENSGVCATLLDFEPAIPIISTNGQSTLATLTLFDLLVENGSQLYYAGDFDPEGLLMAQRLMDRYPNFVHLWRMDRKAYKASKPQKELSKERLEKLRGIKNEYLQEVAEEMFRLKKAGYQEALVEVMIADIRREITSSI